MCVSACVHTLAAQLFLKFPPAQPEAVAEQNGVPATFAQPVLLHPLLQGVCDTIIFCLNSIPPNQLQEKLHLVPLTRHVRDAAFRHRNPVKTSADSFVPLFSHPGKALHSILTKPLL
eukprot:1156772-Pelagomonas_calceolata.AAC.18